MKNIWAKPALFATAAVTALLLSNPAAAALFTYTQTNGDILTIDNVAGSGSLKGAAIDTTFTSDGFKNFQGGANPGSLMYTLSSLDGTRTIGGVQYTDNTSHTQKLIFSNSGRVNLWSYWGNPVRGGDYVTNIGGYTPPPVVPVPAPGIIGLFGLGLAGIAFGRRRKKATVQSIQGQLSFA